VIVHEISGVVPTTTIEALLRVMGVDPTSGLDASLAKGGFSAVRNAIKQVGRDGWSAGQVLEQVSDGEREGGGERGERADVEIG
jgi:replication factor C subunit 2/4